MTKKKVARKDESAQPSFEESLDALQQIVGRLEEGKLPLDDALDQYEQGVGHLKTCHRLLDRAQRRIEVLTGFDEEGSAVTEPFDAEATADLSSEERAVDRRSPGSSGDRGLF